MIPNALGNLLYEDQVEKDFCCGILKINSYIALLLTILTMRFNVFIASAFMTFIAFIPFIW